MSTRTSRFIEQTLRQWDDYAAMADEEHFECVIACVERQRIHEAQDAYVMEPETSIVGQ